MIRLGDGTYRFHHDQGANGDHSVILISFLDQPTEYIGYKSFCSIGTIICCTEISGAGLLELLFQNNELFAAKAGHHIYMGTQPEQLFCLGISDRAADTAADDRDFSQTLQMRRGAKGTHEIRQMLALPLLRKKFGGSPYDLEDDRDRTQLPVIIRYGQRDAFSRVVYSQNDKLPGLCFLCHQWSIDDQKYHSRI